MWKLPFSWTAWIASMDDETLNGGRIDFGPPVCKSPQKRKALKEIFELDRENRRDFKKTNELVTKKTFSEGWRNIPQLWRIREHS